MGKVFSNWLSLALLLLAALHGQSHAQQDLAVNERLDSPWRLRSFTEDAGLTRRNVFGAAFEPDGSVWIAASDGVYFSDGYRWKRYTVADGLPTDLIRSVFISASGHVWVGTSQGLAVFEKDRFQSFGSVTNLAGPSVRRIAQDPDGTMWFASDRWPDPRLPGGLTSHKDGVWTRYSAADGLPSDHVLNYFRASSGAQFVLTVKGGARRVGDRWTPLQAPGLPMGEEAWEMVESPKWGLFLQTQNQLLRWTGQQWEGTPRQLSPLCVTRSGDLFTFLGSDEGTSFRKWDGARFEPVALIPRVFTWGEELVEAPDGALWSLAFNSLLRWSRGSAEWTEYQNLPHPTVVDGRNRLWFAGEAASLMFDGEKTEWVEQIRKNLARASDGGLWSWEESGYVCGLGAETNVFSPAQTGMARIERLALDAADRPWLVGWNAEDQRAVARLEDGRWSSRPLPELEGRMALSVQPDPSGGLWILSSGSPRELLLINGATTRHEIDSVFTTHAEPQFCVTPGNLWLFGNFGLYRLNRMADAKWEKVPGIDNNIFAGIAGTNSLCFLFDGNTGGQSGYLLYRGGVFDRYDADLSGFATRLSDGHILLSEGKGVTVLNPETGERVQHVTLPREAAIWAGARHNGQLWLAANSGSVLRYKTDEFPPSTELANVAKSVEQDGWLSLDLRARGRFENRGSTKKFQYSWRFDGGEWTPFQEAPAKGIPALGLRPGRHILEVRARDEGLHVEPAGARAQFQVLPTPLQEKPWFWPAAGAVLLTVGASGLIAVRRMQQYKAANKALKEEIQQREEAQRALIEERRLLDSLMNSVPDKIYIKDLEGRFLRVNQAMADMFHLPSPRDVLGKTDFDFFAEAEAKRGLEDERQIFRTGIGMIGHEETFPNPDGTTMWVSATKMPLRNAAGKIIGLVGISREMTGAKLAQLQIESQRAEYQTIFDSVPALVIYKDANNRILRANKFSAEFWRRSEREIAGKTMAELDPARGAALDAADLAVIRFGNPLLGMAEETTLPSGETRWLRVDRVPHRDVSGGIIGVIVFAVDITERRLANEMLRKAKEELEVRVGERTAELSEANAVLQREIAERRSIEEELRTTEAFLKSVLENLPASVFIKDARDLTFVLMNKFNQELTGFPEEEAIGKCDLDLFPPAQARFFMEMDREVLRSGQLKQTEEMLDSRHKGRRILLTKKIPVYDAQGRPQYLVGISEDITERRRNEEELVHAKEAAEEANKAKSEFLANMSHEIRTPMNAIIGMTNLLLDTPLAHEQRDYTETVRASGEALLTIINDILDFSKIESGKLAFEEAPFDLREVVESSVDFLAERTMGKSVELASLIESNVWRHVVGDPGRVRQVLANLISNAVKFTERGEVLVRLSLTEEDARRQTVRFEVRDTGIGIDPELQGRLFQPFSQADNSTTRKYGGTGLGLVISKKLVNLMGGEIGVSSVRGKGSTFWFTLPFVKAEAVDEPEQIEQLAGKRVLVVDDNATNRQILCHQFTGWRLAHRAVSSGAEALAELRRAASAGEPFDLAILDMQMPEMDGLALARAIKSDAALSATRTLLLTSLGERVGTDVMAAAGLRASLLKPIRQSELFNALASVSAGDTLATRLQKSAKPEAEGKAAPLRVLLVEDNAVNQKVGTQQVRKLGHTVDVAGNGLEALEAWSRMHYDVILMDCQMPAMDGYEATRQIRLRESQNAGNGAKAHTHIIALTANAMKGDREKCLEAGMDDYISKPVRLQDLQAAMLQAHRPGPAPAPSVKAVAVDANAPLNPLTIAGLRELAGPDGFNPLAELAPLFIEDSASLSLRIRGAVDRRDGSGVRQTAHALKGSSRNLGADRLGRLCETLEKQAAADNWSVASALATQIEGELRLVHKALEAEVASSRVNPSGI